MHVGCSCLVRLWLALRQTQQLEPAFRHWRSLRHLRLREWWKTVSGSHIWHSTCCHAAAYVPHTPEPCCS